jgi:small subunit ribosomal protein S16
MAVHIRLARPGAKKRPFYRIVVTDQRSPRGGRFLENIGTYDPAKDPGQFIMDRARFDYWTGQGAQASETVDRLVRKETKLAAAKATA